MAMAVACDVKGPDNKEGNSSFGSADSPSIADDRTILCTNPLRFANGSDGLVFKSDFLDHVSDMESIVFIHELGHNLGLCHRPGDQGDVADQARTRPANPSECDCCKFKIDTGEGTTNCTHYWVDSNSDTAMGASFFLRVKSAIAGGLGGAAGGAGVGFVAGGLPGAFVGAAIGGIVGFFGGGYLHDLADREINYEDAEWEVIDLTTIRPQDPDTGPGCGDLP